MGAGKEFIGKSIDESLLQGSDYYGVPQEYLKYSILEEKKDRETGESVEVRVWIDKPDLASIRYDTNQSEGSIKAVRSTVQELLKISNLDLQASVNESDDCFEIDLTGPDREFVLDKHGDFLNALQYVIGKIVAKKYKMNKRIIVDSDGFRNKRNSELIEIALHTAERVKNIGEDYQLGPLTPYERRLIHVALSNISGVKTFSIGDGFMKKLTISPSSEE